MGTLGAEAEITWSAADFQDALVAAEFGLADEPVMDAVEAGQAAQQVVAGEQRVVAGGWNVIMWMMFGNWRGRRIPSGR